MPSLNGNKNGNSRTLFKCRVNLNMSLLSFLHIVNVLLCVHARGVDHVHVDGKIQAANVYSKEINLNHVRKRSAKAFGSLDELGGNTNDVIGQASENLDEYGRKANTVLVNVGKEASQNINKWGEEATANLDKFGEEAGKNLNKFGEEATKKLNKFGKDATKEINAVLSNFKGTTDDMSNYASKKGQESIDDIQQWFKEK